jgi:beta-RFAP synthase
LTGRGARSGIGIGTFEQGGLLVDGGRGGDTLVPPLLVRLPFPEDWRLLLIFDRDRAGISGDHERSAFAELPEFPAGRAARLCRLVLMQLLPALTERDLHGFGSALGELQRTVGEHFASAQGGRYSSPAVAAALDWLQQQGVVGTGQSSWGPTGFALCADQARGERLLHALRARRDRSLEFALCRACNHGAEITGRERPLRESGIPLHSVHP